jgi:hypothetical protein
MDTFQDPSPGFAEIMGMWNKRDSKIQDTSPDTPHKLALSGRRRKVMRSSTEVRKKDLIKPTAKKSTNLKLSAFSKRSSTEKWGQSTTNKLVKARRALKNRAVRVRLQKIVAEKLNDKPFDAPVHEKSEVAIQMMRDAIKSSFMFDDLGEEDIRTIFLEAFESKSFSKGDVLGRQGKTGDFFYIVRAGQVDFYVKEEEMACFDQFIRVASEKNQGSLDSRSY